MLRVDNVTVDQTGGGAITSESGLVQFSGGGVTGGLIERQVGGAIDQSGTTTFTGVTILGGVDVNPGSLLLVREGITNNGQLLVNPTGSASNTSVRFDTTGSLSGSGELRLNAITSRAQLSRATASVDVTNTSSHTISGFGQISSGLINLGTVAADVPGQTLLLTSGNVTNSGSLGSENGGTLSVSSITISQTGGGFILADGGELTFNGATVENGEVAESSGTILFPGTNTLTEVFLNGDATVPNGSLLLIRGDLEQSGVLSVNPDGIASNTTVRFDTSGQLTGGTLRLGALTTRAQLTRLTSGVNVTNAGDSVIDGYGQISAGLTNLGLIDANVAGQTLHLAAANIANEGEIRASNDGTLNVSSIAINQTPTGVIRADGGQLDFSGATVSGGSIASENGEVAEFTGISRLEGVMLDSDAIVEPGSLLLIEDDLAHTGVLEVNRNIAIATSLRFDNDSTMSGGIVRLVGLGNRAAISRLTTDVEVINGADHVIDGFGEISAGLVNNGLVHGNDDRGVVNMFAANMVNNAEIRASSGGGVRIDNITVDQTGGGAINAEDGGVTLSSATIVGGSINVSPSGDADVTGNGAMVGVSLSGSVETSPGSLLRVSDGMTNNGVLTINDTGAAIVTSLRVDSDTTFEGTGRIDLNSNSNRAQLTRLGSDVDVTNGAGHTISGIGNIATPLTNDGILDPGRDGPGIMTASAPLIFSDSSTFKVEIAGLGASEFDRLNTSSSIALDGTIEVDFVDGFIPTQPGVITVINSSVGGLTGDFEMATGDAPFAPLILRVARTASVVEIGFTCIADLAVPLTSLDIADVVRFLQLFEAQDPLVDFAAPFGQFDIADVVTYLQTFSTCN
ncbi:MAG: hypothetical protein CMJ31_14355 [Phycisphaerae bacterium]|nr:hypothetical protein [Phycisphaerae bacterium]